MTADQTRNRDAMLDETIEETFPASDPPANTTETGIRIGETAPTVEDNRALSRFEITVDGYTGTLAYERRPGTLTLIHTEVPEALRGRHLGAQLVEAAMRAGRAEGRRIVVVCPFARAYLRKHPL